MNTVTIPKKEYRKLKEQAAAYHKLAGIVFKPPRRAPVKEVVGDFRKTGLYTGAFLKDLEDGLRRSSHYHK